jgi:hypothetical protein
LSFRSVARRLTRLLILTSVSVAVGLLLLEGAMRAVLFADAMKSTALAHELRKPGLYAQSGGADYWKLYTRFEQPGSRRRHNPFSAHFGWLKDDIDAATLAHADEQDLGARTPVLLFGDSFAGCVRRAGDCWQDLLASSELAERYRLLNYGVGGYGFDQAYLLMHDVVARFRAQQPVVAMALLVDDDLDRCYTSVRIRPKPYFTVENDALRLHEVVEEDPLRFVELDPPGISSYFLRWCLFGSGWFARDAAQAWTHERDHVAEKEAVTARLIASAHAELEALGVTHFFLLFHGQGALTATGPYGWQEPFLYAELTRLGVPFVSSKRYLCAAARRTGQAPPDFFYQEEPGTGHYTSEANAIVFDALRDGLAGRFETADYLAER